MGALPFTGPFTLFEYADPEKLGTHAYATGNMLGIDNERERGIVYTRRAGFLDLAHLRNSADMTAYVYARARLAIEQDWDEFAFKGEEPSTYKVILCYPDGWEDLDADERARLGDEIALRMSQRIAFDVMTWHEILTWYGYKSTLVIPEKNSAFSYDDVPSHALGVLLAGEALRSGQEYDREMSRLIDASLADLGVADEETTKEAIAAVEGDWWSSMGSSKRRLLDVGTGDSVVEPWVIESFLDGERHDFQIPVLYSVDGRDFTGFYQLQIDPNVLEGFAIRDAIGEDREYVEPEHDYPVILQDIARSLEAEDAEAFPEHAASE